MNFHFVLVSKLSRNNSRSKSTRVQKPKRRARAPWQKLSLQRMFVNCASCSRICVQNNPVSSNQKIVFCSIIRIKCAFQCGILERFMKRQRIKRKAWKYILIIKLHVLPFIVCFLNLITSKVIYLGSYYLKLLK